MSRHEGVSCDSCLKGNFRGRRYKCLVCYDYDLCATCYEAGATTTRHTIEHPMQCILTHTDLDLYHGGEAFSIDQPQSFTCPFCGKMGFTEAMLPDHVAAEHADCTNEVVCPICASQPGGEPNLITDDFTNHLVVEHRRNERDLIAFLDEPATRSRHVRRIPHPTSSRNTARRSNMMHFSTTGGISSLSSATTSRDSVDPIAELLSQLSGVRRATTHGSASAQLQHLQMQLDRQVRSNATRDHLDHLPRRLGQAVSSTTGNSNAVSVAVSASSAIVTSTPATGTSRATSQLSSSSGDSSTTHAAYIDNQLNQQLILNKIFDTALSESNLQTLEVERVDRSLFGKELLLSTMNAKKQEVTCKHCNPVASSRRATMSQQTTPTSDLSSSVLVMASSIKHLTSEQQAVAKRSKSIIPSNQYQQRSPHTVMTITTSIATTTNAIVTTVAMVANQLLSSSSSSAAIQIARMSSTTTSTSLTPRVLHSAGNTNNSNSSIGPAAIREMIVSAGNNNYVAETSRRKPLCSIDTSSLNQTSESPTSH